MRIAVVGHSLAHIRQQQFFKTVVLTGNDVLLICPDRWGKLQPEATKVGYSGEKTSTFELCPLPATGAPDMYQFKLDGLERIIQAWSPDVVYVQQELDCLITAYAARAADLCRAKKVIFVWENLNPPKTGLHRFDLFVCGNDAAGRLHRLGDKTNQVFLPQVGVDCDHFQAREAIQRTVSVGYIGRPVAEKGINDLEAAWPLAKITPWTEWLKLPWALSGIKVVACPSRDTEFWHEQAMPYAATEAMANGCAVVVSDAGAIPWWLKGGYCEPCESVVMVKQQDPDSLRRGIAEALDTWEARGAANRAWVERNLSSMVIAKKLIKTFEGM